MNKYIIIGVVILSVILLCCISSSCGVSLNYLMASKPVHCKGGWSDWSDCDQECGTGEKVRSYKISRKNKDGGKSCAFSAGEKETTECFIKACPTQIPESNKSNLSQCNIEEEEVINSYKIDIENIAKLNYQPSKHSITSNKMFNTSSCALAFSTHNRTLIIKLVKILLKYDKRRQLIPFECINNNVENEINKINQEMSISIMNHVMNNIEFVCDNQKITLNLERDILNKIQNDIFNKKCMSDIKDFINNKGELNLDQINQLLNKDRNEMVPISTDVPNIIDDLLIRIKKSLNHTDYSNNCPVISKIFSVQICQTGYISLSISDVIDALIEILMYYLDEISEDRLDNNVITVIDKLKVFFKENDMRICIPYSNT